MICDAHVHWLPPEVAALTSFYRGVWTDKEALFRYLDENRIARALVVYPSSDAPLEREDLGSFCDLYNRQCEILIREDERLLVAGLIDPAGAASVAERASELKDRGFRALSLLSSYDGRFLGTELFPLLEAAERLRLPLFVHPRTVNPIGFERVRDPLLMPVLEYPFELSAALGTLLVAGALTRFDVALIFASLGGVVPYLAERFDRVYGMLRQRGLVPDSGLVPSAALRRVYVETSGLPQPQVAMAEAFFGEDRLLWGSDYPLPLDVEGNVRALEVFGTSTRSRILAANFHGLFALGAAPAGTDRSTSEAPRPA